MKNNRRIIWIVAGTVTVIALLVGFIIYRSNSNSLMGGSGSCNDNYSDACVPNVKYDIDCKAVGHRVKVIGKDVYHFDADGDGSGCERY